MKNAILGVLGACILFFTTLIGLGVYNTGVRKNEVDNILSQVVKQTLEEGYGQTNAKEWETKLKENILLRLGSDSDVEIVIDCMDLEKGIIHVMVQETFWQINGKRKILEWEKTAIMERAAIGIPTEGGEN